ncbi:MAG: putative baseplate assembly protein [Pseudomonadota bacterium]
MTLPEPKIDTLTYRALLQETLSRVPVHTPEWTNLNDSDPGVTLAQLFAFMGESVIYRANRIPDRNRQKFLRLLGLPLRSAEPARGLATVSNPRGAPIPITLGAGQELRAGPVPFTTETGLDVLPIESRLYIKRPLPLADQPEVEALYRRLYASFDAPETELAFYATSAIEPPQPGRLPPDVALADDTVDGVAWLALLARPGDDPAALRPLLAGRVLTLGIAPSADSDGHSLPPGSTVIETEEPLRFELPDTRAIAARYTPLEPGNADNVRARPGIVELRLPGADGLAYDWADTLDPLEAGSGAYPPSLSETEDEAQLITWVRISVGEGQTGGRQSPVRLSWVGVNATRIIQQATATPERLPPGTGTPSQTATLAQTPVLLGTLRVTVNGVDWARTDDLAAAPGEEDGTAAQVFTADRQSGLITFGDGITGARPPLGAVILATYSYGGGIAGQIDVDALKAGPTLPPGLQATNPVPTYGASRAETLEEAEARIPGSYRRRNRLVTAEDFEEIARATPGVDLGRVEAAPLLHPDLPDQSAPGSMTIMAIPRTDKTGGDAPVPDRFVLDQICRHLSPRRLITTELHVRGPSYRDISLSIGVDVITGFDQAPVLEAVRQAIRAFLSPLTGGFAGTGWPLATPVDLAEVSAEAVRVAGVAKTTGLLMAGPDGTETTLVTMRGLELPRLASLSVAGGPPGPLTAPEEVTTGPDLLPVPVIPDEC